MRRIGLLPLMTILALVASGQEFEVVSVKPNKSLSTHSGSRSDQGRLTADNMSLKNMIIMAYGMKDYQIEGPAWLESERFDLNAKFDAELPKNPVKYRAGLQSMMQKMLTDRFKLEVHRSQKEFAVYGLVVGKKGIKFKDAADTTGSSSNSDNTHFVGKGLSMDRFAEFLSRRVDLPVVDMTGLKGAYDMQLDWVAEARQAPEDKSDAPAFSDPKGLGLAMAIQDQLGLRLETRKTPLEILIVDHIEKLPTEN